MSFNTDINNQNGLKYKLSKENPNMSKKELHNMALKEISSNWKKMSAEEKGDFNNDDLNLQSEKKPEKNCISPVHISDEGSEANSDDEEECEEMTFGGKKYAVALVDEPRPVYTLEGIEVGTYTTENGLQMF